MVREPAQQVQHRVEFYETDMAGVVHFSNFFRFEEICEHAFLRRLGEELPGCLGQSDTAWPRVSATCEYRAPARFGDLLTITLFVEEVRNRSVHYSFAVANGELPVAEGQISVVHTKLTQTGFESTPLSPLLKEHLTKFVTRS